MFEYCNSSVDLWCYFSRVRTLKGVIVTDGNKSVYFNIRYFVFPALQNDICRMRSTVFLQHSGKAHILDADRDNINLKLGYLQMRNVRTLPKYVLGQFNRLVKLFI